jgi:hypothetical protein
LFQRNKLNFFSSQAKGSSGNINSNITAANNNYILLNFGFFILIANLTKKFNAIVYPFFIFAFYSKLSADMGSGTYINRLIFFSEFFNGFIFSDTAI